MTRRTVIRCSSAVLTTSWFSRRGSAALRPARTLRVSSASSESLWNIQGQNGMLHCLLNDGATTAYRVVSSDGRIIRNFTVPGKHAWFGLRPSGEPIFVNWKAAAGHSFAEHNAQGATLRDIQDRNGVVGAIAHEVCQDMLVTLRHDFSLDAYPLGERNGSWRRIATDVTSYRGTRLYTSSSPDARVLALDGTAAVGASVNVRTGQSDTIRFNSPEIEAAKKYYGEKASSLADGQQRHFIIVPAMAVAPDGSLWAMVLPSDAKIGLNVVGFDKAGKHLTSKLCEFQLGKKPTCIVSMDRTLYVGFSDGDVLAYSV